MTDLTGSPGRNLNRAEKACNLFNFRIRFATDTPKDTPFKRWLLPDVVGSQFTSIRMSFCVRKYSRASAREWTSGQGIAVPHLQADERNWYAMDQLDAFGTARKEIRQPRQ